MDLDTAGKWFGRLNQKDGSSIISEDVFSKIFSDLFGELGEDTIKEAIAKGTASKGFKGALSAGISGFAGGLAGIGESIGTVGTGLVSFLGSIWPLLAVGGGIFAGIKGYQALNDKFTLTKGMADKHYSQSTQEYANNQSELESLQSQRDSNQERIYELRAKENKSTDEKAELSQLQEENNLLDSQVAIKEKSVDVSKLKAANDAKTKLEKKGYQFVSDTDTEVIAHLLDYYYHGNPLQAVTKIMHRMEGSYALGIIFKDHPDELYAVRMFNILIIRLLFVIVCWRFSSFFSPYFPMQKCSKIFPSTISFVTSPAISLRWKIHSRISCETKSPDRFSASPCWTRWMASKAWVKAS